MELISTNPVTGEIVWKGNACSDNDVAAAVENAHTAFKTWSQTPFKSRQAIINRFAELLQINNEHLATVISQETGKPLWEAKTEVSAMAAKVPISIDAFEKRTSTFEKDMPGRKSITRFKPHGVIAVFGPFNFPGHLPNGHIVPALLAGNTVLFKPSSLTAKTAEETHKLWREAGLPENVLTLTQGNRDTGQALLKDNIQAVFFTGSSQTGVIINEMFAHKPNVITALEMGGNNPLIVWGAKDETAAACLTIQSAFITAGQRCTCSRRLIIQEGAQGENFINSLVEHTQKIRVGEYTDNPEPFMGSVISHDAALSILKAKDDLVNQGAKELVPIRLLKENTGLLSPGIIDVTGCETKDEEIFGPLLQVKRVSTYGQAITEANNTAYGLAAGLISDDEKLYETFYNQVDAGIINWNNQLTGASSGAPFGGVGLSGNHRPSAYFAADYCSYPVASLESESVKMPATLPPGLDFIS